MPLPHVIPDDARLLDAWMERWRDLVDFAALPVLTAADAAAAVAALGADDRT